MYSHRIKTETLKMTQIELYSKTKIQCSVNEINIILLYIIHVMCHLGYIPTLSIECYSELNFIS